MRPRNTITLLFLGACLVGWLIWNWPKDHAASSNNPGNEKRSDDAVDKPPATAPSLDAGRE